MRITSFMTGIMLLIITLFSTKIVRIKVDTSFIATSLFTYIIFRTIRGLHLLREVFLFLLDEIDDCFIKNSLFCSAAKRDAFSSEVMHILIKIYMISICLIVLLRVIILTTCYKFNVNKTISIKLN